MQTMLRSATLVILLHGWTCSAYAIDQSGSEETNCLMACDANQEHCAFGQHILSPKLSASAARASVPEAKLSSHIRLARTLRRPRP